MKLKRYIKKPVIVEVIKYDEKKWKEEISRGEESKTYPMVKLEIASIRETHLDKQIFISFGAIETLEGNMIVKDGDFIIKGVQGEYYPCKPDIFHETYEEVV